MRTLLCLLLSCSLVLVAGLALGQGATPPIQVEDAWARQPR
jgi:hypothetical protein